MNVALEVDGDGKVARLVKARLERTVLGQVAHHIKLVLKPGGWRLGRLELAVGSLWLDMHVVRKAWSRPGSARWRLGCWWLELCTGRGG